MLAGFGNFLSPEVGRVAEGNAPPATADLPDWSSRLDPRAGLPWVGWRLWAVALGRAVLAHDQTRPPLRETKPLLKHVRGVAALRRAVAAS